MPNLRMRQNLRFIAFHRRQNKLIRTEFGMQVYIVGLLQCSKFDHDRFRGWVQDPLVNIMYSTAAAQNRSLLKIRPQVSSLTRNFTFSRYLGVIKEKKSMCLKCLSIKVTFFSRSYSKLRTFIVIAILRLFVVALPVSLISYYYRLRPSRRGRQTDGQTDKLQTVALLFPHRRRLRSASTEQLDVPTCHRSTIGGRAFPVAGAQVWNSLPSDVASASWLSVFKNRLKTYLFRRCYETV